MAAKDTELANVALPRDHPEITVGTAPLEPARNGEYTPPARRELPPEFLPKNTRRIALIHKQCFGGGLTPEEDAELEQLNCEVEVMIEAAFPLPKATPEYIAFLKRRHGSSESAMNDIAPVPKT